MKHSPYDKCLCLLKNLKKTHSAIPLSVHLATAFSEYEDISFLSDNKLLKLLQEYQARKNKKRYFNGCCAVFGRRMERSR